METNKDIEQLLLSIQKAFDVLVEKRTDLPVPTNSGRHSFASLITLEAGVPMETICKMLGHKDVKMTQRYARVTQKKLFEDMDKFIAATEKDFVLAL